MRSINNLDLGSVKVHKNALAEIIFSAVTSIEGVTFIHQHWADHLNEFLGIHIYPGIHVEIDENYDVIIEVKVIVKYGLHVADVANQIQDVVKLAIEKMVDINLRDINVNIQGIERGTP